MTPDSNPVYPIEFEKGDHVGVCESCGPVVGDDVEYNFPALSECGICGDELERVTVAGHSGQITEGGAHAR